MKTAVAADAPEPTEPNMVTTSAATSVASFTLTNLTLAAMPKAPLTSMAFQSAVAAWAAQFGTGGSARLTVRERPEGFLFELWDQ